MVNWRVRLSTFVFNASARVTKMLLFSGNITAFSYRSTAVVDTDLYKAGKSSANSFIFATSSACDSPHIRRATLSRLAKVCFSSFKVIFAILLIF